MSFLSGLVDSFTGASAKKDLQSGIDAANSNLGKQTSAINSAGTQAQGYQDPYLQPGGAGFKAYADSTGANGSDAANSAYANWLKNNPLQAKLANDQKIAAQGNNAQGNGPTTGVASLAANRVAMQDWQSGYQNPLLQLGQMGQSAANASSGIAQNTGAQLSGAYGGNTNALMQGYGGMAQSENTLAQNLIGAGGVAASAFGYGGRPTAGGVNNLAQRT